MEILNVDAMGRLRIPPAVVRHFGLRPGDSVRVITTARGIFISNKDIAPETLEWWNSWSFDEAPESELRTEACSVEAVA